MYVTIPLLEAPSTTIKKCTMNWTRMPSSIDPIEPSKSQEVPNYLSKQVHIYKRDLSKYQ
jgi:hypothetical protein